MTVWLTLALKAGREREVWVSLGCRSSVVECDGFNQWPWVQFQKATLSFVTLFTEYCRVQAASFFIHYSLSLPVSLSSPAVEENLCMWDEMKAGSK